MNSGDLRYSEGGKRRFMADEVLRYLVQHPEAQDTMEGIAEWWLLERRVAMVVTEVEATLVDLVGRDFVIARRFDDGRTHYRLNRKKEREIRRHLRKPGSESGVRSDSRFQGSAGSGL